MCGIVGIIKKNNFAINADQKSIFKQLLYSDALRGWDSTGMFTIPYSKNEPNIYKEATTPQVLLWKAEQQKQYMFVARVLIGHNRSATHGKVDDASAHPFKENHITLVHNGTLWNHKQIKDVDVDSHAITHLLAENNPQYLIDNLKGSYALTWWNEQEGTLNILRNKERPLSVVETDDLFIISSELKLTEWICDRNNIKINKIYTINPHTHYFFKLNDKTNFIFHEKKLDTTTIDKQQTYNNNNYYKKDLKLKNFTERLFKLDISEGDYIDMVVTGCKVQNNSAAWSEHFGHLANHKDIKVSFYSPNIFQKNEKITGEVYYISIKDNQPVLTITNPEKKKILSLETASSNSTDTPITKNNIALTQDVIRKCIDKNCISCGKEFIYSTNIILEPIEIGGHIYNYRYFCPTCASKHNVSKIIPNRMS